MNRLTKNEEEIRKVLNEQEFAFDESHWEAAQELLDREMPVVRKKRRGLFWLWLLPLLALLGASGWWALDNKGDLFVSKSVTPSMGEHETDPIPSPVVPSATKNSANDTNYAQAIISNMTWDDATKDNASENQVKYEVQGGPPALMVALMHKEGKEKTSTGPAPTGTPAAVNSRQANSTKQGNGSPSAGKQTLDNNNEGGGTPPADGPSPVPVMKDGASKDITYKVQAPLVGDGEDITGDEIADLPAPVNAGTEPTEIDKPAEPKASAPDTTGKKEEQKKKEPGQRFLKNSISPVAGGSFIKELNPAASNYKFGPYFGIMYNRYLNEKWQLAVGVGYSKVDVSGLSKQYSSETYSFGVQRDQTEIGLQKLYYVDVPLLARYSVFGSRISIMGGFNAGILVNTSNTLTQSSYNSLKGAAETSQSTSAYREGLTNIDWQLQLGVEGHFFKDRLHAGFLLNNSLSDVTINNYYNNSVFDRNRRIQVYLRYDVIRF